MLINIYVKIIFKGDFWCFKFVAISIPIDSRMTYLGHYKDPE